MTDGDVGEAEFVDWVPTSSPSSPPPPQTLQWVERELHDHVVAVEELAGGLSSAVHRLTGYSEDVTLFDLSTVLSGPVGTFPTHAWNARGRHDLTSDSVAPRIDGWLRHLLDR